MTLKAVFLRDPADKPTLRELLLRDALVQTLEELVPGIGVEHGADDPAVLDGLERLSALPQGRQADPLLSVGLVAHRDLPGARAFLICTRPLAAELEAFARRRFGAASDPGDWVPGILALFDRIVFLDRFDLAESLGFAAWAKLTLADRFPLRIEARRGMEGPVRVLAIDHDGTAAERLNALGDQCRMEVLDPAAAAAEKTPSEALSADIHVHLGYSSHARAVVTPFDSILGGVYTVVRPADEGKQIILGDRLKALIAERSYACIAEPGTDLAGIVAGVVRRVATIRRSGAHANPETARFQRSNDDLLAERIGAFREQVFA